jgi:hypothetical protein
MLTQIDSEKNLKMPALMIATHKIKEGKVEKDCSREEKLVSDLSIRVCFCCQGTTHGDVRAEAQGGILQQDR